MTIPRLPTMSVPALRPKLQKIALEEAYATKAGVKLDDKGNPDWAWFMEEQALNKQYVDVVAPRLLDFDEPVCRPWTRTASTTSSTRSLPLGSAHPRRERGPGSGHGVQ
jgi:hypothetical protein